MEREGEGGEGGEVRGKRERMGAGGAWKGQRSMEEPEGIRGPECT